MSAGKLFLIGVTHHTAPIGERERLALTAAAAAGLADELAAMPGLLEFVILNTCNRIEIYGVGTNAGTRLRVAAAYCSRQGFLLQEFERLRVELTGRAVVSHLLEVASGLDSQMLGENEIFGQVKRAYEAAQVRGSTGPVLNRIFQKTFQAAKHVRSHTAITAGLVSVANVAVELAASIFGDLGRARVLLLGAGEIGLKSGRAFRSRAPAALAVASRRLERAQEVAVELAASALGFEAAVAGLADFDVVVCSTAAPTAVISPAMVSAAMERRGGRPLFFIDVALPRDVAPGVAELGNVFVYNLDDLAAIAADNRSARQAEVAKCQVVLGVKADVLWAQADRLLRPVDRPAGLCPATGLCLAG